MFLVLVKKTELCLTDTRLFTQQTFTDNHNPCLKHLQVGRPLVGKRVRRRICTVTRAQEARAAQSAAGGPGAHQEVCWKAVSLQLSREECRGLDETKKGGTMAGAETQA